ncbi:hypothetical protein N0V82_010892 [Gnomoniopsis sp. IMI 355080]|nr:hypothetical protein N0V82_010892 [Gnomoniopsis sp. IMI 355080]
MIHESAPKLSLVLTPRASQNGSIDDLRFSLTICNLHLKAGDFLCTYARRDNVHPASRLQHFLQGTPATIRDDEGSVPFDLVGEGNMKDVHVTREILGNIVFASKIRALEFHAPSDDGHALRRDRGGIVGAGAYFLPCFPAHQDYVISVAWDLEACPQATRAVCSFGEGPLPVQCMGKGDTLLKCAFAVGPLRSFPEAPPQQGAQEGFSATYWFGELPDNVNAVQDYATKIYPAMSAYFNDEGGRYRAFLRLVPQGFRGIVLQSSSIIDYDEDTTDEHDWDLVRLLNKTMVSTWVQMTQEDDGRENDWFTQGLSYLLTVYLPFRFKQRGPDYFRATVNAFLSAYYTNPFVAKQLSELDSPELSGNWGVTSAKAARAFVYMLKMDAYLRRKAKARGEDVERPLEELVRQLCTRRKDGEKIQRAHWIAGIAYWLGPEEAEEHFRRMLEDRGQVSELSDMESSFGTTYGPQLVEQEGLEFGFDKSSLEEGVVSGVVKGSRAAEAGLRDGDQVTRYSRSWVCELDCGAKFKLEIERDGERLNIEYRPRSREKVSSWQVLERPK